MQEIRYHNRLFVGEGDFSFTCGYIEKHPEIASFITATEIYDETELNRRNLKGRVQALSNQGVKVFLEVDATKLHEIFRNEFFERIHWNLPWDGNPYHFQTLPNVMRKFFLSCSHLQRDGDRVHVTIPQPSRSGIWKYQQGYIIGIVEASVVAGYILVSKRFMKEDGYEGRYPFYETSHSYRNEVVESAEERSFEFIFQKHFNWTGTFDLHQAKLAYREVEAKIKTTLFHADEECWKEGCYFDIRTDSDSSEGYSEAEECDRSSEYYEEANSFSEGFSESEGYTGSFDYSDEEIFE